MATVKDVDALLEETARDVEMTDRANSSDDTRDTNGRRDDRRDRRDRDHSRYVDRRDRNRDRERSRDRYRESNGNRRRSYENVHPRRSNSRDRYARRDRGGDFYSGSGRARSRSPHRDRGGDRHRERSRDRRHHDDNRRNQTPPPEAISDEEKDKRTIFVQQISQRAEDRHLRAFFEAVGVVVHAEIVRDRITHRSKGVGYVQFKEEDSVPKALQLTGQKLKGVPIIAQLTEAEKNRVPRPSEGGTAPGANGAPFHRLYVGNIHFSVTEKDLEEIFSPFGELDQVILQRDETNPGRSKGYGFVQFVTPGHAKSALNEMNGFELAGRQIRVGLGNDKFTPESTANLLRSFTAQAQNYQGSAFSGAGGRGAHAGGSGGVFDRTHGKDDRGVSGASALDDSDVAGVNFRSYDRSKLMAALSRDQPEASKQALQVNASKPRATALDKPMASKCIKIENAFDADQELKDYGPSWIKDLEKEVKVECDEKYGKVLHIAVEPNSDGEVYVKFDSVSGGEKALQGLNGRSFNRRTIRASYVVDKVFNSLYGGAADRF